MYISNNSNSHIENLGLGLTYLWVNHSEEFVNEFFNDIHINNLERKWRSLKGYISHIKRGSFDIENLQGYIDTIMLKFNTNSEMFYDVLLHIISYMYN